MVSPGHQQYLPLFSAHGCGICGATSITGWLSNYAYHFTLHAIYKQEARGEFRFTSTQLRIWNEVATILLIAIVMLAVVKQGLSVVWGLTGLALFIILLMSAIRIYKMIRTK